jgi:hypothetical protein
VRASCWVLREAGGEIPPAYSPAKEKFFRMPTSSLRRKAKRAGALVRVPDRSGVVRDPGMYGRSLHGNREISGLAICSSGRAVRGGKARSRSRRCTTRRSLTPAQ